MQWLERFTDGEAYARIASEPPTLTNRSALSFSLISFRGRGLTVPPDTLLPSVDNPAFEYKFWNTDSAVPAAWLPCSATASVTATADGSYTFNARVAGQAGSSSSEPYIMAVSSVTVDTTPPVMVVRLAPAPIQSDPVVLIKFQTVPADDAVLYVCR